MRAIEKTAVIVLAAATCLTTGLAMFYSQKAQVLASEHVLAESELMSLRESTRRGETGVSESDVEDIPLPASAESGPRLLDEDVELLHERIEELEAALSEKNSVIATLWNEAANGATNHPASPWNHGRQGLEELKQSDPDRYAEIIARREELRKRVNDSLAQKAAHFLQRDPEGMGEEERAEYVRMLGLLDETWRLTEQIGPETARSERRELRRQVARNLMELQPMMDTERDRQLYEVGVAVGFDEGRAAEFVDYMNELLDITSLSPMYEAMRRGPPPGGIPEPSRRE